jgi:hypothetical protein
MTNALPTQITLAQFEIIDGLFNDCLRRPQIEDVMAHPYATRDYLRTVFFVPEWKLFDACIEAMGYSAASEYASASECAAALLTACLTGKVETLDAEAA